MNGMENGTSNKHVSLLNSEAQVYIKRPAYNQPRFNEIFNRETTPEQSCLTQMKNYCKNKCQCSGDCMQKQLFSWLPFILMLKNYEWKNWIVSDLVAGVCVGVIHIPQSMGFALLNSLPPVYGLYSTVFPIVIYFLLGTSRHISVGTMAVISIMSGVIVDQEAALWQASRTNITMGTTLPTVTTNVNILLDNSTQLLIDDQYEDIELIQHKVKVAMSVTLMVGLCQLAMSFLNLGIIATFMPMSFVGSFMAGAAVHIITSQAPFGLGYGITKQSGIFRVPKSWYYILFSIENTNVGSILTFIFSSGVLITCKLINDKYSSKMKFPIPSELIVVTTCTLVSYLANFHERFNVRILKDIPTGIPEPQIPTLYYGGSYFLDCIIIAITSYAISISMVKTFSIKYSYPINLRQELFAQGVMHSVSPFFYGFAGAQAPPRTLVHEETGGKSQVASLVCAFLVLMVCLVLAPMFEPLPTSALSAIIIIALLPLFKQIAILPTFWRINKNDCIIWVVTFLSVVILNMDIGLGIGLATCLFTVVWQAQVTKGQILAPAGTSELYQPTSVFTAIKNLSDSVFIYKFDAPLYFVNVEKFKTQLFEKTINPKKLSKSKDNNEELVIEKYVTTEDGSEKYTPINIDANTVLEEKSNINTLHVNAVENGQSKDGMKTSNAVVILDCSVISYIDLMGLNVLKTLKGLYNDVNVEFVLAGCSETMLEKMKLNGYDITQGIYPSIQDAVSIMSL